MAISLALPAVDVGRDTIEAGPVGLPAIVEAIGNERFGEQLLVCLDGLVGADHCSVFRLRGPTLSEVASAGRPGSADHLRSELTPYEARRQLAMSGESIRIDVSTMLDPAGATTLGRSMARRQKVTLSTRRRDVAYCLRFTRSSQRPEMTDDRLERLRETAGVLFSAIAKHIDMTRRPDLTPALCSLPYIEACIATKTDLSRREGEVCARIVFGLSTLGIALDLGIGKESVTTYRKRAYQRLGLGSQRELLMWYLSLWSAEEPAACVNVVN